jgi:hypothetical protein
LREEPLAGRRNRVHGTELVRVEIERLIRPAGANNFADLATPRIEREPFFDGVARAWAVDRDEG